MKDALKKIFMTHSDAAECTFIPKPTKPGKEEEEITNPVKTLHDRLGQNLSKQHPDVYKYGVFL